MKKRLLCPHLPRKGTPAVLSEAEAHHAIRVLRLRDGELIEAMDGKGHKGLATLRIRGGNPRLEFLDSNSDSISPPSKNTASLPLILEMAVLKGEAMEWVVEKSVELGVNQLIPILTDYTVVQMKSKSPESFKDRWQKIADQALKQCGRLDRMEISLPISFEKLLTTEKGSSSKSQTSYRLWCDETSLGESPFLMDWLNSSCQKTSANTLPQTRILVGPEGGWSSAERNIFFSESQIHSNSEIELERINLGPRILRAETAALFSMSLVSAHLYRLSCL